MITGSTAMAIEIESLRQQIADHIKREVRLREVITRINKLDYAGSLWRLDIRSITDDALAATDDMKEQGK